ncbi:MAG: immune inhibitor A [Flavobacteriia bacterium]|nr:immune inhibitor A [Flavobacteriia bacterium]
MKQFITILSMLIFSMALAQDQYSRVKIITDYEGLKLLSSLGIPVDHGIHKENTFLISDFSATQIQTIKNNGFEIEILIEDVKKYYVEQNNPNKPKIEKNVGCSTTGGGSGNTFNPTIPSNFNLGSMGGFFTYQEFLSELDAMAAQYPNLISVKSPISNFVTFENRPIYWVRISDNPSTDETIEPEVLYTSVHHAREPNAMSEVIFYMWYLLENYNTSDEIKYLVDNTEMYFVPCVNPDGYVYNQTTDPNGGGMHRKNRRDVGTTNKGVDLNRNYSYGWGTTGVSMNVDDDTYPGTGAFSEPETQAIKWFCENRDFVYASNAHTYSNDLLHPIGTTTAEFAVDHAYFEAYTQHMAQYSGYTYMKSSDLYPASGDSDDYMYKVDLSVKPQIFSMTPEVGSSNDGFWPASSNITNLCIDMLFTNIVMSHLPHKYIIVKDLDASIVETQTGNFSHSAYRLGYESGNVTVSIEPLLGIQSVGNPIVYNLALMETQNGTISYVLNPTIQFGDVIKYVLKTDNGLWTKRDTIVKTFGSLTLQFADDATNNSNWNGNWSLTSTEYYSPSKSFTDSPSGNYTNNATKIYTLINPIDLSNATSGMITYYAKWDIETDFDMTQFQISTDNGVTWQSQCGNYTVPGSSANGSVQPDGEPVYEGQQSTWVKEEISLSSYLGQSIKARFLFKSDGGMNKDGFYFDDFEVSYNLDTSSSAGLLGQSIEIKTFPNPANNSVTISTSNVIEKSEIQILDQSGKIVWAKNILDKTNKIVIDTELIPQGFYTIILMNNSGVVKPEKLVILH